MNPEDIKEQELSEEQLDEATGGHTDPSGQQSRNNDQLQNRNNNRLQNRNNDSIAPGRG